MDMDDVRPPSPPVRVGAARAHAAAVANYFLIRSRQDLSVPSVDQLKLQALVFYAQCWHLVNFDGTPLFHEDIEAWPWGPVVRPIHNQTKRYGDSAIGGLLMELSLAPRQPLLAELRTAQISDDRVTSYLDVIWTCYKDNTGVELCNSTHAEGEPWAIVKNLYGDLDHTPVIPKVLIAEVCRLRLRTNAAA